MTDPEIPTIARDVPSSHLAFVHLFKKGPQCDQSQEGTRFTDPPSPPKEPVGRAERDVTPADQNLTVSPQKHGKSWDIP